MSRPPSPYLPPAHGDRRWIFRPGSQSGMGYETTSIADGDRGTEQTIEKMIELARQGANNPGIREAAERAVMLARVAPKDYRGELRAIHDYVKANVRYTLDPRGKEQLAHPNETLFVKRLGDCDDFSILIAAMAGALGHGAIFRAVKADPARPNEYSHVYVVLAYRDASGIHAVPADATTYSRGFGWEPPLEQVYFRRDWVAIPP